MPKLTSKPVEDKLVGSHILAYGIHDLEKTLCSTLDVTLGIQGFTLMLLLICVVNPNETIGFALRVGKLDAEFLVGLFQMRDSAA